MPLFTYGIYSKPIPPIPPGEKATDLKHTAAFMFLAAIPLTLAALSKPKTTKRSR